MKRGIIIQNYNRLTEKDNIDEEAQCMYRYVTASMDFFSPHCHDFFEIFITAKGTVEHWVNGKLIPLPEGSLVFIRPDDVHSYWYASEQSKNTAYVNLTFSKETARQLFQYLSDGFPSEKLLSAPLPPYTVLSHSENKRLLMSVSELNTVKWKDKKQLKLHVRMLLAEIFTNYFSHYESSEKNTMPRWLKNLADTMKKPENFMYGAEKMTELSGKSREHLARSVKKHFGVTLSEFINDLRMNYAANLLINTNFSVLDVCFECGFQNVSWFYSVFENKYGVSPGTFRKNTKINGYKDASQE